jgi:hypothetical protein
MSRTLRRFRFGDKWSFGLGIFISFEKFERSGLAVITARFFFPLIAGFGFGLATRKPGFRRRESRRSEA